MFNGDFSLRRSSIAKDGQQKVRAEYIYDFKGGNKVHKVRVTVVSDAYRQQCEAKVERFDGTKWQMLGRLATADINTAEGLCYADAKDLSESKFSKDIESLKQIAEVVLS